MKDMSKAVGKSETFIQQYIKRGTPKYLPEEVRYKLAKVLGVSEELLRGRDLDAEPNGTTPTVAGRADFDMWAVWNTASPEERPVNRRSGEAGCWPDQEVTADLFEYCGSKPERL